MRPPDASRAPLAGRPTNHHRLHRKLSYSRSQVRRSRVGTLGLALLVVVLALVAVVLWRAALAVGR